MKISELIKKLEEKKATHGDVEVVANVKEFHESFEGERIGFEGVDVTTEEITFYCADDYKELPPEMCVVLVPEGTL